MATSWKSQQGDGEYRLQFETDDKEKYKLVEKAAQMAMDGKTIADVEEAKHGEWKECFEDWRKQIAGDECSACGFRHYGTSISDYNYCLNCGAKMDGGKAE